VAGSIIASHILASGLPADVGYEVAFLIGAVGAVGAVVAALSVLLIPGRVRAPAPQTASSPA